MVGSGRNFLLPGAGLLVDCHCRRNFGGRIRHYHKPINFIFIDTRHKQADYSIINTVYRYAPILRLDVGRMIDNKHMTDLEAVSNYRG